MFARKLKGEINMERLNQFNPFFDFEQFFTFREVKVAEYLTTLTLLFKLWRIKDLFFHFNEFCLVFHISRKLRYFLRMKVVKLFFIKERYDKFKANPSLSIIVCKWHTLFRMLTIAQHRGMKYSIHYVQKQLSGDVL